MTEQTKPATLPEQEVGEGQVHGYVGEEEGDVVTTSPFQPGDSNVDETPPPQEKGTIRREDEAKSRSPRENK
jgi:hypothetical protein